MACFLVPLTEAVVTTVAAGAIKAGEKKSDAKTDRIRFSSKLGWLNKMLFGGSALLAFEHLWHGEIVPWFPFLTAASDPEATAEMLHEMSTVGVSMAVLVTGVWACMCVASSIIGKKASRAVVDSE